LLGYDLLKGRTKNWDFWYNMFVRYGNWMIIFTNFIPISMLVSLDMVKFFQAKIMMKDKDMMKWVGRPGEEGENVYC
jgi:phospholipid-transporting ATPase